MFLIDGTKIFKKLPRWYIWTHKDTSFTLAADNPGNSWSKYLKHRPSSSRAFTNCFMQTKFFMKWGRRIFSRSTKVSLITFLLPIFNFSLAGYSLLIQCWFLYLLFHSHKKHGYFIYHRWIPRSTAITFKSAHMVHMWYLNLSLLKRMAKFRSILCSARYLQLVLKHICFLYGVAQLWGSFA